MTRKHLLLFSALLLMAGCQEPEADFSGKVIGRWKYDPESYSLDLAPDQRQDIDAHGEKGKEAMEKSKKAIIRAITPLVFEFKADGTMQFGMDRTPDLPIAKGTWSAAGRTLNIKMITPGQGVPEMTIEPDGRRIKTIMRGEFGVGSIDLVKQ